MTTTSRSERCPTCRRKHKRNFEQNALYWTLLHRAADQLKPGGQAYSPDSYHTFYKSKFLGCDDVKLPNGKVMAIPRSTTDLDVAEFSEYYTKVEADLAERGVFLADLG